MMGKIPVVRAMEATSNSAAEATNKAAVTSSEEVIPTVLPASDPADGAAQVAGETTMMFHLPIWGRAAWKVKVNRDMEDKFKVDMVIKVKVDMETKVKVGMKAKGISLGTEAKVKDRAKARKALVEAEASWGRLNTFSKRHRAVENRQESGGTEKCIILNNLVVWCSHPSTMSVQWSRDTDNGADGFAANFPSDDDSPSSRSRDYELSSHGPVMAQEGYGYAGNIGSAKAPRKKRKPQRGNQKWDQRLRIFWRRRRMPSEGRRKIAAK